MTLDAHYLLQSLELAKIRKGYCAPNPSVGSIIINEKNDIIATGFHLGCGSDHAEVDALQKIGNNAPGSTMFVSLEPCCHWGKTPPCTDAIIHSGIRRVVYGYRDPNSLVAGKGDALLKSAGIICDHLSLPEINEFYECYRVWQTTHKPLVTIKLAMSMDAKIAFKSGAPVHLTGESLDEFTHCSRKNADAILTTIRTICNDDPQLTARCHDEIINKSIYILDTQLNFPLTAKVMTSAKSITLFYSRSLSGSHVERLEKVGVRCIGIDTDEMGLNLDQVLEQIGLDGVHDLWVEAGSKGFASFARQKLFHRALIYIAGLWLGEGMDAFGSEVCIDPSEYHISWKSFGSDVLCEIVK